MKYSLKEIIDMAVELEKTGAYFYEECAKKFADSDELNEFFNFLSSEEVEHKKIFSDMLADLPEMNGEFTDEYFEYLSAIISGRIFRSTDDVDGFVSEIRDVIDAFHAAIQAEKDSILFYSEMKVLYSNDLHAIPIVEKLIDAERSHLVKLTVMLNQLK